MKTEKILCVDGRDLMSCLSKVRPVAKGHGIKLKESGIAILSAFLRSKGAWMFGYELFIIIKKTGKTILDIVMKL